MLGADALRAVAGRVAGTRGFARLVDIAESVDRPRQNALAVLMYHRVADPAEEPGLDPGLISARPPEFAAQMEYLARTGRVVSLEDILAARRGDAQLPPGALAITFDDAYRDFAEHAWPAIRSRGLPVTLFVPTGYPDRPEMTFWWDRLHHALVTTGRDHVDTPIGRITLDGPATRTAAFKALRDRLKQVDDAEAKSVVDRLADELDAPQPVHAVLGWDELRDLAADGVTMGPHTRTHAFLDQVSTEQARAEIAGSRDDLERELGTAPAAFAFPAGQHTDAVVDILQDEGFEVAFTTEPGINDLGRADWLRLRRINIGGRSTLSLIRARLLSFAPAGAS